MAPSRLRSLIAAAAVAVLSLSACSTGPADSGTAATGGTSASADAFPVTIEHAFGETTLTEKPERVATVSWVNADVSLALGVVPVGMPADSYGGNENQSTPWKDAKLEELDAAIGTGNAPVQYSETDGIAFDDIAATNPDVILAAYSGLSQEDYDTLSKIAPVVAYPEVAYGTAWQDSTRIIGKALGLSGDAEQLVSETEQAIADAAAEYPQLEGKTFIYGNLEPGSADGVSVYTENDNRPRFLTELGMVQADVVTENTKGSEEFFIPWSAERANELDSDIFVTWVADEATKEAIAGDALLGQIPAVEKGALVADSDNTLTLSISAANPLSLVWALDRFLPMLGEAADKA
ncbi:iron-siderophore ABC transporter substrate-binding protein [Arthrobacter burdickii]|jgi:iron complex transport system substrate-binding protein|uniref:Iron-siderophore ABC transporter substrate-binding protein n=1 Tax=Arthrobacter burdickii TaxID=3035920 RepID=A0ABT8K1J4_9MICC|nr:iron-siderophore ABC transporter substrate-binding protein [Arthrobacter burdickii]MDN4610244.1 iron-siderophore ABC transporter substrate-binding protein [Arthrobacter burdickii]